MGRPETGLLPGYVALGCWRPADPALDPRLEALVAQLSAELSGCVWCVERGRHAWRKALLPAGLLGQLQGYRACAQFSAREAAALGLVEAVARYTGENSAAGDAALLEARRYFSESELARLARLAAGEHFFDPATGSLGRDGRAAGGTA